MAIKFYLHQIDNEHEIHCNTNSTFTEVAGAFDIGTMELEWNECKNAIFPYTPFFIKETTSNRIWSFVISEDQVEIVSKNPVKYLHRLTLSQNIHKINNVPLRNTVFSQPYNTEKIYKKPTLFMAGATYNNGNKETFSNTMRFNIGGRYNSLDSANINSISYEIANYKLNLSGVSNISSIKMDVTTIINVFATYDHLSNYINNIQNIAYKYVNLHVNQLVIQFIDTSNSNVLFTIRLNDEDLWEEYTFTTAQINLLKNKQVIAHISSGTINNLSSRLPNTVNIGGNQGTYFMPLILGLVTIQLRISSYNYSLWDILDTLNKQCRKQYNGNQLPNFYTMPSKTDGGQGQLLAGTIAPEFNFTQMDLYEAVAKTLSFIDAFPVLDENGVLGFQYLNDLSKNEIKPLLKADDKMTLNETNFTNKLGSYYQNGRLNYPITFPSKNRCIRPSTSNYGVPSRNNWYYYVQKPIDYIDKIIIRIPTTRKINLDSLSLSGVTLQGFYVTFIGISFTTNSDPNTTTDVDITEFVLRSDIYNQLSVGQAINKAKNRNNTLYYSKGGNTIYCGSTGTIYTGGGEDEVLRFVLWKSMYVNYGLGNVGLSFITGSDQFKNNIVQFTYNAEDKTKWAFNAIYHPIIEGKVSEESTINKVEKETIVAQANNSSELNRLGNNLQGLIAKLGNEEHAITLPITDLSQKIELGTKYIDELGNSWIANKIQTTFTTSESKVCVNVTFTKNFNAMAQFTSLNQEKRFYQISEALTNKGYENINEFIYFTHRADWNANKSVEQATPIALKYIGIDSILAKTLGHLRDTLQDRISVCDFALMKPVRASENTGIQPIVYGLGNQICFEFSFDNSISAGRYTDTNDDNTKTWSYTASDGIADYINIECRFTSVLTWNHILENYPKFTETDGVTFLKINQFYYYKKPNEIFHTNYSICFLPYWTKTVDTLGTPLYHYEEIFFGDKFINENGIIPNTDFENGKRKQFTLWVSNEKYSIIDNKVLDSATKVNGTITPGVYHEHTDQGNNGCITHGAIDIQVNGSAYQLGNVKSWALADEDGNIYIAVNREFNEAGESLSQPYPRLWFFTSRYRKI